MILLTKELKKQLPKLNSQENKGDEAIVYIKFFHPASQWTWYVLEGEQKGTDYMFFGYVRGFEDEYGYFMLSELEEVVDQLGLKIERDLYFRQKTIGQVKEGLKKGEY